MQSVKVPPVSIANRQARRVPAREDSDVA
jgi:hypothetical protein